MLCSLYSTWGMPGLAGGTVFARGGGITLVSHGGVEWNLSGLQQGQLILPQLAE